MEQCVTPVNAHTLMAAAECGRHCRVLSQSTVCVLWNLHSWEMAFTTPLPRWEVWGSTRWQVTVRTRASRPGVTPMALLPLRQADEIIIQSEGDAAQCHACLFHFHYVVRYMANDSYRHREINQLRQVRPQRGRGHDSSGTIWKLKGTNAIMRRAPRTGRQAESHPGLTITGLLETTSPY